MAIGALTKLAKYVEKLVIDAGIRSDLASQTDGFGVNLLSYDGGSLFDYFRVGVARSVDSIVALRALKSTRNKRAFVFGYYLPGDGGGGAYWHDTADTTSADNGGTIIVATDGARWKLRIFGHLSVKQFGAKGDGVTDDTANIQLALNVAQGKRLHWPAGTYIKSARNQIFEGTHLDLDSGATIKRMGTADGWMFVNGEVGNTTFATLYNGPSFIKVTGGKIDLNGFSGRSAAAFVLGHSKRVTMEYVSFTNGWESHYIEINASTDAMFFNCTFENQGFEGASSYEVINVDSANAAGFPGWGTYDLTTDNNIHVLGCTFRNVYGTVSSHGIAAGAGQHTNIKFHGNTLENIATKGVRAQGWNNSSIMHNTFINIGHEAISILTGHRNIVKNNIIIGASTLTNGSYSAIRIDGDENVCGDNTIRDGGYTNKYPYAYGVAAGSRNKINTINADKGTSGFVSDSGTLTSIDNLTLLFAGAGNTPAGTVVTLGDSINNYSHLQVTCGAVAGGLFQTGISIPFARRNWAVGTDSVAIATAQGRFVATVTTLTTLTVTRNDDSLRYVYGVAA